MSGDAYSRSGECVREINVYEVGIREWVHLDAL